MLVVRIDQREGDLQKKSKKKNVELEKKMHESKAQRKKKKGVTK